VDRINPESAPIEGPLRWIELASLGIELLAVGIIVLAIVYATVRYVSESLLATQVDERYERYKRRLGRSLLLGLEILVAADIVRTVALDATLDSVIVLGLLVVIRTFLSWSLVVEIEGRWPWQQNHVATREERKDDS
jgi:uncharacterized membrane protein